MSESAPRLPLAHPVAAQDPADYTWTVPPDRGEAHAVLFRDGQAQPRALCNGRRWQASWTPSTAHPCLACVAELRDQLRAVSAALAAAGINLDQETTRYRDALTAIASDGYGPTDQAIAREALGWEPEPDDQPDDQAGDHFRYADRPGEVDVIDARDGGRNER